MSTATWGPAVQRVARTLDWPELPDRTEEERAAFLQRLRDLDAEAAAYYGEVHRPVTPEEIRALHGA